MRPLKKNQRLKKKLRQSQQRQKRLRLKTKTSSKLLKQKARGLASRFSLMDCPTAVDLKSLSFSDSYCLLLQLLLILFSKTVRFFEEFLTVLEAKKSTNHAGFAKQNSLPFQLARGI